MLEVAAPQARSLQPLRDDGLQIIRNFFTGAAREDLQRRAAEVIDGVASGRVQRSGQFALGFDTAWFEGVFGDPRLLDLVAQVLGPDLCIGTWRVLMKDHHFDGPINVHQDWPYFGGDTRKLNVFVPMTPMNAENGGLVFYEKSHHYGPLERGDIDVGRFAADLPQVCPSLEVGDVLLADFLTWHYSAPSQAPKDRILFQLMYQPADDPSSAHVVRGRRNNPFVCPDRYTPLSEPLSLMNVNAARSSLQAGDIERAERFARGMLASDGEHAGAALLLADVLEARGDVEAARIEREKARIALVALQAQLDGIGAVETRPDAAQTEAEALAKELADIKASRSWRWTKPLRRR